MMIFRAQDLREAASFQQLRLQAFVHGAIGKPVPQAVAKVKAGLKNTTRQQHSWGGRFWRWLSGSASQIWMFYSISMYFIGLV